MSVQQLEILEGIGMPMDTSGKSNDMGGLAVYVLLV